MVAVTLRWMLGATWETQGGQRRTLKPHSTQWCGGIGGSGLKASRSSHYLEKKVGGLYIHFMSFYAEPRIKLI